MGTTLEWYREGGPMMFIISLIGIAGLAILVERVYVIVLRAKNNGRVFIERIIQLVRGGKVDEAIKQCAASTAALSDIGLLLLRSRSKDETELRHLAHAASLAVLPKLTHRLQYLLTLGLVAVLIGAAGTLWGFHGALMAQGPANGQSQLSAGLAAALTPAIFGLAVCALLVLGRGYLVSQAETITEQIHEFSARLINALMDRPDVRLGHR
jgi:biopolymer transport protein ExbB